MLCIGLTVSDHCTSVCEQVVGLCDPQVGSKCDNESGFCRNLYISDYSKDETIFTYSRIALPDLKKIKCDDAEQFIFLHRLNVATASKRAECKKRRAQAKAADPSQDDSPSIVPCCIS
jgi:hypothetical protein